MNTSIQARRLSTLLILPALCAGAACIPPDDHTGDPQDAADDAPVDTASFAELEPGAFSTPSPYLYALNDGRPRGFPQILDGGLSGNGHSVTWDGRLYVRATSSGWQATAFRPERIVRNPDGTVSFNQGAFGGSTTLESIDEAPEIHHNWLAIVPDPTINGDNPYSSDALGTYDPDGDHHTYEAVIFHTAMDGGRNNLMGLRRARFVVSAPHTADAEVVSADFTTAFQALRQEDGSNFRCIEPTVTMDGRLIVCQGHPTFDLLIDKLVYSWNPEPVAFDGWSTTRSIADMYEVDREVMVDGVPFEDRYPLAQRPLLDAEGVPYAAGELVKGAYPWISRDGSELFYQASSDGVEGTRTGTSVVGRWTGWAIRHIDGPINRNRHETDAFVDRGRRLFLSSPGAFTTMWAPFKDVPDLAIPYSVRGPSFPIFGSNSRDYSEVAFDDYLDGDFVVYLGMNEQLDRRGIFQPTRTHDTSGNFNNGTLVDAMFPLEYDGRDEIVGRYGQAIYFPGGTWVEVTRNQGWDGLDVALSIDLWVKRLEGSGPLPLFRMEGGLEVGLTVEGALQAAFTDTTDQRLELDGGHVGEGVWTHVALTFDGGTREATLYVDGAPVAQRMLADFGTLRTSGEVRVGLIDADGLVLLDEVKVSRVVREPHEIAYYANRHLHVPAGASLAEQIPDHLSVLASRAVAIDRFSTAAANLGEDLFHDTRLSRERSTSCVTCHLPDQAFADGLRVSDGNESTGAGKRNTPTIFNRLFSTLQGWSGEAPSLNTQALVPIQAVHEMNLPIDEAVARISREGGYASRFREVYGQPPDPKNLAAALGAFMATRFAPPNRVDRYLAGDTAALSTAALRGLRLFEGKARCSGCHAGQNYTDESFRNNGLTRGPDPGRATITGRARDRGLFKVPTLRELERTAPYLHDGSLATLRDVVMAYNEGSTNRFPVDTDIRPLELSDGEVDDLVAFLRALSADGASD